MVALGMRRARIAAISKSAEEAKAVLRVHCRPELPGLRQLHQAERSATPPSSCGKSRLRASHITYIRSAIRILTKKTYVTGDNLASQAAPERCDLDPALACAAIVVLSLVPIHRR